MPDSKADIRKINEIIGDRYHQDGCGVFAAMAAGGTASHVVDGDASVILEMLAELAAVALVEASHDRKQMEQGLMQFIVRVAQASSLKFDVTKLDPDLHATMALDGENIQKMREALRS